MAIARSLMTLVVFLLVSYVVFACSGEQPDVPSQPSPAPGLVGGSPGSGANVAPTTTATGLAGLSKVPVRWLPVKLDFDAAAELVDPFAEEQWEQAAAAEAAGVDKSGVAPSLWTAFLVDADGSPKEIYKTGRRMDFLEWTEAGLHAGFTSRRIVPTTLGRPPKMPWRDEAVIDTETGDLHEVRSYPGFDGNDAAILEPYGRELYGQRLVSEANTIFSLSTIARWGGASVYVVDSEGVGFYLAGLPPVRYADWFPGSNVVRVYPVADGCTPARGAGEPPFACASYLVPVGGTEATLLPGLLQDMIIEGASYSPGTAVFIFADSFGVGVDVGVVDRSGNARILARLSSVPPEGAELSIEWAPSPTGAPTRTFAAFHVKAALGVEVVIDPVTGSVRPRLAQVPTPSATPLNFSYCEYSEVSSPDTRYLAIHECDPRIISVLDRATGVKTALLTVDKGEPIGAGRCSRPGEWLDDRRLLITLYPGCGIGASCSFSFRTLLADASTSQVTELTDGWEMNARLRHLTENRLLVHGTRHVRIYGYDGVRSWDLRAAPGLKYVSFAVSPDGNSFAYILGPDWMRQWWC